MKTNDLSKSSQVQHITNQSIKDIIDKIGREHDFQAALTILTNKKFSQKEHLSLVEGIHELFSLSTLGDFEANVLAKELLDPFLHFFTSIVEYIDFEQLDFGDQIKIINIYNHFCKDPNINQNKNTIPFIEKFKSIFSNTQNFTEDGIFTFASFKEIGLLLALDDQQYFTQIMTITNIQDQLEKYIAKLEKDYSIKLQENDDEQLSLFWGNKVIVENLMLYFIKYAKNNFTLTNCRKLAIKYNNSGIIKQLFSQFFKEENTPLTIDITKMNNEALYLYLYEYCTKSQEKLINALIDHPGININAIIDNRCTLLIMAIKKVDEQMIKKLFKKISKNSVILVVSEGNVIIRSMGPLYQAIILNSVKIVEIMMDYYTPEEILETFCSAIANEKSVKTEMTQFCTNYLINKLDINHRVSYYCTNSRKMNTSSLVELAIYNNHIETVQILFKHNPNLNTLNLNGMSLLMAAIKMRNLEMAKILIQNGADVNIQNDKGKTALIYAVRSQDVDLVKTILAISNIDIDIINNKGETALDYAKLFENDDIIKMLEDFQKSNTTFKPDPSPYHAYDNKPRRL